MPKETDYHDLESFILHYVKTHSVVDDADHDKTQRIIFEYNDWADLLVDEKNVVRIRELKCLIDITLKVVHSSIHAVKLYWEDNRVVGQEAEFQVDTPEGIIRHRIRQRFLVRERSDGKDKLKVDLTIVYPDELPSKYGNCVLMTHPSGFESGKVKFPLNCVDFGVLQRSQSLQLLEE